MKKVPGTFFQKRCQDCASFIFVLLFALGSAHAQNCPPIDVEKQKAAEQTCRAAGGVWSRFGAHDYLCNVYSCAERTKDADKPCRNRLDCEHACVTNDPPRSEPRRPGAVRR